MRTEAHDDVADAAQEGRLSRNPAAAPAMRLDMPAAMRVRLVDASRLLDYEIWTWVGTGCLSGAVGLGVAAAGNSDSAGYWLGAAAMSVVVVVAVAMAIWNRRKIKAETQTVVYREGTIEVGGGTHAAGVSVVGRRGDRS